MQLNDKEMTRDLLSSEKHLAAGYNLATTEAANQELRNKFQSLWKDVQETHAKVFHELHRRGWYKTPTASETQINSTINSWEKREHKEPALQR